MPTAPRSLKQLFLEALAVPPAERDAWLSQECPDAAVRQQIELMLAAHDAPQSLLDRVAPPPVTATLGPATAAYFSESIPPSATIGPYKLLQQLGEGGMGVVYMAEQSVPVERRVALKIIKPGMDTRQVIARFEAERQALAMMDHPNIAKVFDAGTTSSGRPYFVMELVRGIPITRFCDEHHLTLKQRLELFLPVCHAVQHAHQKGIIHRDLKPSNVLVAQYDDQPVPKVIDFGVAKAAQKLTERTMFTEFGQVVGTLEYMSPEQARLNQLDIDTRSDIYSLGVLLYELLTGCTPFDGKRLRSAAFDEMLRIIREEEPPKPSTRLTSAETLPSIAASRNVEPARLSHVLRGELDWIVMKALEKDRNRRYETTNGLARDIERYLADEPVQACPPSAGYRLRKFGRRNKVALATSAVVFSALLVGIAVSTWQAVRAIKAEGLAHTRLEAEERARRDAETARDGEAKQRILAQENAAKAEEHRQRAEANFGKARQAVDEYLTQVTETELLSVPGLQPLREDLLQAALKFYAEFTQERADDPTLQRELASAHYRLGTIERDLGNAEAAQQANQEAIRLYEQLRDQGQADTELQAALATAYFFANRYDDTVKLCQTVLQEEPQHGAVRSLLADTYNQLAVTDSDKKKVASALKYHQQAFELREALVRDFPDDPRYLAQLGGTVNNLGALLSRQNKQEEALAMYERAVEYSAQAYERAPHSILWGRWLCTGLMNVATNQEALDRQEEALRSYERLVAVSRKRAFENPAIGSLRADLYRAHLYLGKYHQKLGNAAEGIRCFRLARELLEQTPRETPDQLFELAMLYAALASPPTESLEPSEDDMGERKRNADLAMETLQKAVDAGYQNASVLGTNQDLKPLRERDDFQALLATVQKVAEADRLAKAEDKDAAKKLNSRQQAADLLKGLASAQPSHVRHRATLASTLQSIGLIQMGLKQLDEAEKSLGEALKLREELLVEQSQKPLPRIDVLSVRASMGQLDWERDRPEIAHRLWQEILGECQRLAVDHAEDTKLQTAIVGIERSIADQYGAIGLLEETLRSVDRGLKTGQLFESTGDFRGAYALAAQGRVEEHRKWCQLIAGKWNKTFPAQTVWATTMNPRPVLEEKQLLELADRVINSDLDSLWKFKAATAWYRTGDPKRALELMLAARDKVTASTGSAGLYWLALVYHKLGQQGDATRYFEQAEAKYLKTADSCLQAPGKSAVKDAHGGAWSTWAEDQAARRAAWNELRGDAAFQDPWQHLIRARGFRLIGEQDKSLAELAAADVNTPNDRASWKARLRLATRFEDAERIWRHMVDLAADDPLAWIERGRWYVERAQYAKADADGWVSLFNGKDLTGWRAIPPEQWRAESGVIRGSGKDAFLVTELGDFEDFHLLAEYRINANGDSGIQFRLPPPQPNPSARGGYSVAGLEAEIGVRPNSDAQTGALSVKGPYRVLVEATSPPHAENEWARLELVAQGDRIQIRVNGKLLTDYIDKDRKFQRGHIALCSWENDSTIKTAVEFRKIEIRKLSESALPKEPAPTSITPAELVKRADADFAKAATLTPDELNKFIEPGWWAAKTPGVIAPLVSPHMVDLPAPTAEATDSARPTVVPTSPSGRVEFRNSPGFKDVETAYVTTYVYSPEAKAVMVMVGGEEPVELHANGRRVYEWKARSWDYNTDRIPVLLRAGRNTFVARVSNPSRVNSLILRIGDNRLDRGLNLARLGLWDEALILLKPELAEGKQLGGQIWNYYSALLLATGDVATHREFCRQVVEWMGDKPQPDTCLHASQILSRDPLSDVDIARVVQLVDEGVAKTTAKDWPSAFQQTVYYRAGRYQEVLNRVGTGGLSRLTLRALCWHHLGDPNKARADLERAEREFLNIVKMGPDGPASAPVSSFRNGLLDIVSAYVLLREARTLIAPDSSSDDLALHALKAQVRETLKAADPRLAPYEITLMTDGKNPHRWLERGRARAQLGKWELAQADFAKAIAMAPRDPEVLATRSLIYAELNRLEEARADLDVFLNKDADYAKGPKWPIVRQRLLDELGRWPELFEHVTQLQPSDPGPWVGRARHHASRLPWVNGAEGASLAERAMADLREAASRGFREFDQTKAVAGWHFLEARDDFKQLVRETAERNADDLQLLAKLDGHKDVVRGVALLPDGQRVVTIGRDKQVRFWDLATREEISKFAVEGYLRDADVSADGRRVAVVFNAGEGKGVAHVWDLEEQQRLCELVQPFTWTNCIRISPDGKRLVTSGIPAYGILWDVTTGKELRRLDLGETSNTQAAAFSPDGKTLALGSLGRVWLYDAETADSRGDVRLPNNRSIFDLTFDSSGKTLASGQLGGYVTLIDVQTRRVTKVLQDSNTNASKVQFVNNDRFLLCSSDTKLQLWDVQQQKAVGTAMTAKGTSDRMTVSPDGRYAFTASGEQWDTATNKFLQNGDYALRVWQLPRTVWNQPSLSGTGKVADRAESKQE